MLHPVKRHHSGTIICSLIITLLFISMQGCVKHVYEKEPVNLDNVLNNINSWSIDNPTLNKFLLTNGIGQSELNSHLFSIKRIYLTGLYYSPDMQLAYKEWNKAKLAVNYSDYKINPEISIPFEHHSDTSDGRSEWTIGAVLSFIYERKGKREARKAKAEVGAFNAELKMRQIALELYHDIEKKFHDYVFALTEIAETKNEIDVLEELSAQLQKKYELGAASQFEVSTVNLELQRRLFQLSIQNNNVQTLKDDLLSMTHVNYRELDNINIESVSPYLSTRDIYENAHLFNSEISDLQKTVVDNNLELAIQLNVYALSEAELRLEIEKQYPDIVLSPGFIFDQSDNIWALGASWILPLFNNSKQNLEILKSLQERKLKQQEITALQEKLLNSLYKAYRSIKRHKETITVSDEIINSIEKRADEIKNQIEIGGIENIVLLRNRMELFKAKQTQLQIYSDAINAMLEFEHFLQSSHSDVDIDSVMMAWLNINEKIES